MKKCDVCKRLFDDSQSFCLDDGTPLVIDTSLNTAETVVIQKRKRKAPIVFVGLLTVLVLGIIGSWSFLRYSYGGQEISASPSKVPTPPIPSVSPSSQQPSPTPSPNLEPSPTALPEVANNVTTVTNSDIVSTSNTVHASDSTKLPPVMKAEEHFILFNLHQCRKSGTAITCFFTLTNKGDDRELVWAVGRSAVFDELGNSYRGSDGQIANRTGDWERLAFVSGVTTKAQMTFDRIEANATKITLLRINFSVGQAYELDIKFRNVPLIIAK